MNGLQIIVLYNMVPEIFRKLGLIFNEQVEMFLYS